MIVGDEPCPSCRERGGDKTGNHLIVFDNGNKYCNRCGYKEIEEAVAKNTTKEFDLVKHLPIHALPDRGISQKVCEHYGVHVGYSEQTGEPEAYYYPFTVDGKIVAYKKRVLPKEFLSIGAPLKGQKVDLIGQHLCTGGKKLLITEGQDDMLAAFQMLWEKYPKYKPSVVSLPNGANIKAIADNLDFIHKYEEVIFCPDNDEAGRKIIPEIAGLVDGIKIMHINEKDANDMLLKRKQAQFIDAFFKAETHKPEGFVTIDDVFEEATRMPEWGRPWPWPSLTKLTYGMRDGEGAYFGAGVKIGKSEAVNEITHDLTQRQGGRVALFKLEEKPSMSVRKLAGKIMKKPFHKPDGNFSQEELVDGVTRLKSTGNVVFYDSYGMTEWDRLKVAIRHAVVAEGVKTVIIDPLTRLTSGMPAADANTELERIADEISRMAKDLGFFYIFFCHLKAPLTGKPHEEGGKVHSNQFTGSRAMMRACYYMVGIERDKSPDLSEEERNTSRFVLLEDRAFGNSGWFEVFFNKETGDYLEPEDTEEY